MSQEQILDLLEIEKRPLSRGEISEKLNEDGCKISHHINKLIKHNEICFFEIDRFKAKKLFGAKAPSRRIRLYYLPVFYLYTISLVYLAIAYW